LGNFSTIYVRDCWRTEHSLRTEEALLRRRGYCSCYAWSSGINYQNAALLG
jgi:hypothetical protein